MEKPHKGGWLGQGNRSGAQWPAEISAGTSARLNTMALYDNTCPLQSMAKVQVIIFDKYNIYHLLNTS